MNSVETQTETQPRGLRARISELTHDVQRGFIAEWAVTIVLLLFGTTTLLQAFVIPSASMVGTLLIGDHVLVDKMVYSPARWWRSLTPSTASPRPRPIAIISRKAPTAISKCDRAPWK